MEVSAIDLPLTLVDTTLQPLSQELVSISSVEKGKQE